MRLCVVACRQITRFGWFASVLSYRDEVECAVARRFKGVFNT